MFCSFSLNLSSNTPSNWHSLGPLHLTGYSEPVATVNLMEFLQAPQITTRVLLYLGDHGSFDLWQIRTILRGLQDRLTQVIVLGDMPNSGDVRDRNVLVLSARDVSPLYLINSHAVTAAISFCDNLLVQASLYAQIPLLCVPSRRNRLLVKRLVAEKEAIQFPEGFWTESTVHDCVRQLLNLEGVTVDRQVWEGAVTELKNESLQQWIQWSGVTGNVVSLDEMGWLGAW